MCDSVAMKKFIVSLVFTVDETAEIKNVDKLRNVLEERGYLYFQVDHRNPSNNSIMDLMIEGHAMSINVTEIDCK